MSYPEVKCYKHPKEIRAVLAQIQREYRAKKKASVTADQANHANPNNPQHQSFTTKEGRH